MFVTLISWAVMLFLFYTIGMGIDSLLRKWDIQRKNTQYDIIWYGTIFSIVYAQFFSLFCRVGILAFVILFGISILSLILTRKVWINRWRKICNICSQTYHLSDIRNALVYLTIFIVIIGVGLLFTIQEPTHYDTYLYHAQSIRWIEEYGIVKGLGNLHNRFAYNSSFMCLQALFSFSWLLNRSLHTLNGFLWVLMALFSVCTLKIYREDKLYFSDILRTVMLLYLCCEDVMINMSSPHTDMMPLIMVLYIIIRWNELSEENYQGNVAYGVLCLFGVCAVSVKLSAAMILVLVLKPAYNLLREKKWKDIGIFLLLGTLIILPFLLRNFYISGYLVYPYANIDLFDVDWKMEKALVINDNREIVVWGRMLFDTAKYDEPITMWLPIWMQACGKIYGLLMLGNLFLIPVALLLVVYELKRKAYDKALMLGCVEILFLGWLFTAPLPRYGLVYLFLGPAYIFYLLFVDIGFKNQSAKYGHYLLMIVIFILVVNPIIEVKGLSSSYAEHLLVPADYSKSFETECIQWQGMDIYIPLEGDRGSYDAFPETPNIHRLKKTELRGTDVKDGFKLIDGE